MLLILKEHQLPYGNREATNSRCQDDSGRCLHQDNAADLKKLPCSNFSSCSCIDFMSDVSASLLPLSKTNDRSGSTRCKTSTLRQGHLGNDRTTQEMFLDDQMIVTMPFHPRYTQPDPENFHARISASCSCIYFMSDVSAEFAAVIENQR